MVEEWTKTLFHVQTYLVIDLSFIIGLTIYMVQLNTCDLPCVWSIEKDSLLLSKNHLNMHFFLKLITFQDYSQLVNWCTTFTQLIFHFSSRVVVSIC
jgi:hypothetical protein